MRLADDRVSTAVLGLLALDGILSAIVGALLLPVRIGPVAVPVSALLSGVLNAVLVWAAAQHTSSIRTAGLPLWTWLATVVVLTFGGPGGDVVFGGSGVLGYSAFIMLALGAAPAAVLLRRMAL